MLANEMVIDATCKVSGYSKELLLSRDKRSDIVRWRAVIVLLLYEIYTASDVGRYIGRSHATVLYLYDAYRKDRIANILKEEVFKFVGENYGENGKSVIKIFQSDEN